MPNFNPDNYIDVQERINRFWTEYPNGAIRTNLMSPPDDFSQCRYKAEIFKDNSTLSGGLNADATGWAFEIAGQGMANKTSHEENCETSAIGRALANMGYATTREDRPSRQEVAKVSPRPIRSDAAAEYQNAEQFSEARHAVNASTTQSPSTHKPPGFVEQRTPFDADAARMRRLHAVAANRGLSHDELHDIARGRGKNSLKDLNPSEMDAFTNWLEKVTPPNLQAAIDVGRATATAK